MADNLYKRGDTWWGRVTVRGQEIRTSLRTKDRAEARRRLKAWIEKEQARVHFGDDRLTFSAAAESYLTITAPRAVKPGTLTRYESSLLQIAGLPVGPRREALKDMFLDQVDRMTVGRVVDQRRAMGVEEATIRRDLTAGSRVFAASMVADPKLLANPFLEYMQAASNAGTLQERREPIVLPDPAHVEMVLELLPGLLRDMVRAARLTGMRQGELVNLTWGQVNKPARQVTLTRTKTDRARAISLSPQAAALFDGLAVALRCPWVFWHNGDTGATTYANVSSRFHGYVQQAARQAEKRGQDFRPFRFHDLRHLYAVEYLKAGGSIYDLQKQLGHSSITTTETYLDYLTPEEAAQSKRGSAQISAQL